MGHAPKPEGQLDFTWDGTQQEAKRAKDPRPRPVAARHLCATCRARRAFLRPRGSVTPDRTLCFRCYHAERQSARAARAAEGSPLLTERRTRPLSAAEVEHRRQMLEHMRRQSQIAARRVVG